MIRAEDLGGPGRTSRLGSGGQTVSIKRRVRLRPRPRGRGVHSEAGPTRSCRDPSLRPRRRVYAGLQDRDGCGARGLACCGRGSFLRGGLCRRPIRIAMRREALGPSNGETGRPRTQLRGEPAAESSRRRDQSGRRGPGGTTRRRALRTALHPKPPLSALLPVPLRPASLRTFRLQHVLPYTVPSSPRGPPYAPVLLAPFCAPSFPPRSRWRRGVEGQGSPPAPFHRLTGPRPTSELLWLGACPGSGVGSPGGHSTGVARGGWRKGVSAPGPPPQHPSSLSVFGQLWGHPARPRSRSPL